jgi:hypothetical protein
MHPACEPLACGPTTVLGTHSFAAESRSVLVARPQGAYSWLMSVAIRTAGSDADEPHPGVGAPTSAALFGLLWNTLSEILGTAVTATLVRRACKRAAVQDRSLLELSIVKTDLVYTFTTPQGWSCDPDAAPEGMRALLEELRPLLVELTGAVVIQRLERLTEFQKRGLVAPQGEPQ